MAVDKQTISETGVYFITFTNYRWLHLFEITNGYDLVYKWFDTLKKRGNHIIGYVIMPNHLHLLVAYNFELDKRTLNIVVGSGRRFIAYEIIKRLKAADRNDLLSILAAGVTPSDIKRGKLHEVYQPSVDIKQCYGQHFIDQKLEYMHNNPVSKKWMLAVDRVSYPHSSAQYYDTSVQGIYPVVSYVDLLHQGY